MTEPGGDFHELNPSEARALARTPDDTNDTLPDHEANLHGGDDSVDAPPPRPTRGIVRSLTAAVVGALGRNAGSVTSRTAFGREVTKQLKSKDVFEVEQTAFAEGQLAETRDKWDAKTIEGLSGWQRFGKRTTVFFDRIWRGTFTESLHRTKEKAHGARLSEAAGITGAVSAEFNAEVDRLARARLARERNSRTKRVLGGAKDFFQELIGHERDLHKYKVEATRTLRAQYDVDPTAPNALTALINRDVAAREELARRVNESPLELLQETRAGDKKTVTSIKLEGPAGTKVADYLKQHVLGRAIDDIVTQREAGGNPTKISPKLRRELDLVLQDYFHSADFQAWRQALPADQQAQFENSFTYASDLLTQTEEVMLPAIVDNLAHYKGAEKLNFDIELNLGTAQLSANSEIGKEGFFSRDRLSNNAKLWARLHQDIRAQSANPEHSNLYRTGVVRDGLRNERILSAVDALVRNEVTASVLGLLAGKGLANAARAGMSWLPFVGSGLVGGGMAGFKEWARLGRMRAQYGFEEATGLDHPHATNAIRSAELRARDYHRIELGKRAQLLKDATDKLNAPHTNADIFKVMAYVADSGARLKLSNERGINLLSTSKETPEGRGIYNRELRVHDAARAAASARLAEILADDTKRGEMAALMGVPVASAPDGRALVNLLQASLVENLLSGTTAPAPLRTALTTADPELLRNAGESIRARDKAFNGLRWKSSLKRGVTTGVIAGLSAWGLSHFSELHEQVVQGGTETMTIPVVDHTDPLVTADLPHGIGQIVDPETGDVLSTMNAHIPPNMHLEPVVHNLGGVDAGATTYNLVADNLAVTDPHHVVISGLEFGSDGTPQITDDIARQMAEHHLDITTTVQPPVTYGGHEIVTGSGEIDYTQWSHSLTFEQMHDNPDNFFAHNLNHSFAEHPEIAPDHGTLSPVERVTQINGLRNFWRGMENHVYEQQNAVMHQIPGYQRDIHYADTIWGKEILSAPQSDTLEMTHLPALLATEEGNRRLADLINESVRENIAGDPHYIFSDEAHRIAWEMSYWGDEAHIPDADEVRTILEYFQEIPPSTTEIVDETTVIPHDVWMRLDEDLMTTVTIPSDDVFTQTVPTWSDALVGIGYFRPLERAQHKFTDRETAEEESFPSSGIGGSGFGNWITPERRVFYESRLLQRIKDDPAATLEFKEEAADYFSKQSPAYMQQLNEYMSQPEMVEPMHPNCDAVSCIAVYGLGEGKIIQNALEQYYLQIDKTKNQQAIDPSKFELILFVNYPKNGEKGRIALENRLGHSYTVGAEDRVRAGNPEIYDTEEVIRQFKLSHPELKIRVMKKEFNERPKWGSIIKPLYDAAMYRSLHRPPGSSVRDPLIITNDIDVVKMSPTYMRDILQTMDLNEVASWRNPNVKKLDGMSGKTDMDKTAYEHAPGYLVVQRLYQYLENQRRSNHNHSTQGRNTIIRMSTLAGIGGINEQTDDGADGEIGTMVALARKRADTLPYLNRAWLETDPRREINSWSQGIPLIYNWASWAAMDVYGANWKDRFTSSHNNPDHIEKANLEKELNEMINVWGGGHISPQMYRAMQWIGLRNDQFELDRAQYNGVLGDPAKKQQLLDALQLRAGDYHEEPNGRIIVDKAAGHLDYHVNYSTDPSGRPSTQIVIDNLARVEAATKAFVDEKRSEITDRRIESALKSPNLGIVPGNYYIEYPNYEEFDGIYGEIHESHEYDWTPPNTHPTIIDLGAHIGMSVAHWKNLAKGAKITAVEANPETTQLLKKNITRNNFTDITVVDGAISAKDGTVDLYMPKEGVDFRWGDFVGNVPQNPDQYNKKTVNAVKLSSLIHGPTDLLKIDIEGSEVEALKEAGSKLGQVKDIIMEFHNDPDNANNKFDDMLAVLQGNGFRVELIDKGRPFDAASFDRNRKLQFMVRASR